MAVYALIIWLVKFDLNQDLVAVLKKFFKKA